VSVRDRAVTVDASVWVASAVASETHHATSMELVRLLWRHQVRLVQPTLFPIEVAAALGRRFPRSGQAQSAVQQLASIPRLAVVPLDAELAPLATRLAADHGLRGADAVYVATALMADATLLTLDEEVIRRAVAMVPVQTPQQWLASW
jgi:predicted nucleic acid-binding protein